MPRNQESPIDDRLINQSLRHYAERLRELDSEFSNLTSADKAIVCLLVVRDDLKDVGEALEMLERKRNGRVRP